MEEVIKEKPLDPDTIWFNAMKEKVTGNHDFYQLKYSFKKFSNVNLAMSLVKNYENLLFSYNQQNGFYIVTITNQSKNG